MNHLSLLKIAEESNGKTERIYGANLLMFMVFLCCFGFAMLKQSDAQLILIPAFSFFCLLFAVILFGPTHMLEKVCKFMFLTFHYYVTLVIITWNEIKLQRTKTWTWTADIIWVSIKTFHHAFHYPLGISPSSFPTVMLVWTNNWQ